jgi:diguanylate cyclase (GGDEF)-like protein
MEQAFLEWSIRAELWSASTAMAIFACYVALDLSRGVSSRQRFTAWRSLFSATVAFSAGIWATHFISVVGNPMPFPLGYDALGAFSALAIAAGASMLAIQLSARKRMYAARVVLTSIVVGTAVCAVPVVNTIALRLSPPVEWNWVFLLSGWAMACLCAGAALTGVAYRQRQVAALNAWWQGGVALGLGLAIAAGNAAVLNAAAVPLLSVSIATGGVSSGTMTILSTLVVPAILALLLASSVLETHFRRTLKRLSEEVKRAAQIDRLTDLPNRSMFEEALQVATIRADRHQHKLALLFINIDGLKTVNESFGQSMGDSVLCEVGKRLRAMTGQRALAARAGGDEFLLLLQDDPGPEDAQATAQRILQSMNDLCRVEGHDISMSCTIGVALYPEHGNSTKLIAHAAAAMRSAKATGGGTHCFFEERMVAGARAQVELLQDLRRAIAHNELELYYQPKIHAPSGQITGAEALMRWNHPQRGMVGPNIFIPLAERYGLINAMGNWLIEEVCRQVKEWRDQGLRMRVAINLSVHQLRQADLVERIEDALMRNRIDPSLLTCEITESSAMDDTRVALGVIERLSALGVHLSIDDFGTGYSSLSYLRQLAAAELKIDRSFVLDLETSADARAIVDAVVKLAQALSLKVVAEGVETEQQQDILRGLGCNELQGYLFAKPMPAKALALWAMQDEGPRALDFRPSLFGDTLTMA